MRKSIIFALLSLLLFTFACDRSDDITDIFVSKTWKMTYIASGTGKTWYSFDDVTADNYSDYTQKNKTFTLAFSGVQSGDKISGTFIGNGSVSVTGTWNADAKSRDFSTVVNTATIIDDKDVIAQKIVYGLKNATSYKGDVNNLFLYFNYKGESLYMAFLVQ